MFIDCHGMLDLSSQRIPVDLPFTRKGLTTMSENAVAIVDDATAHETANRVDLSSDLANFSKGNLAIATSLEGGSHKERVQVLKAMEGSVAIADVLTTDKMLKDGEVNIIRLANYLVHPVAMQDEKTKQWADQPRVILIDDKGESYHGISNALYERLKTFISALGKPASWGEPLEVYITHDKGNNGFKFYNLHIA